MELMLADTLGGALVGGAVGTFILPAVGTVGGLIVGGLIGRFWGKRK